MYIEDSHAGDGDGPELYLYRNSASPADNDSIGIVKFLGRNDNSQDVIYGQMQSIILDASDGTEDAKTVFNNMIGGSSLNMLQFDNTGVVINESSNDLDFRVESNGNTHMLFVDGGNDHINIGGSSDLGGMFNVAGNGVFQNDDQTDTLSLVNTDADANVGPRLKFARNSASPAVNDYTGDIRFEGKDDAGNDFVAAQIRTQITGVTNGSEEGKFWIETMKAGTARQRISIAGAETILNLFCK
jgi:hypothetical protein